MNTTTPAVSAAIPTPKIIQQDGQALTSSVDVAEYFGKRHDHVMKAIELLEVPESFRIPNFRETETTRPNPLPGRAPLKSKSCRMTKKGFILLVMGFTGKKAIQFKLAYIEAFEAMEQKLLAQASKPAQLTTSQIQQIADLVRQQLGQGRANPAPSQVKPREQMTLPALPLRRDTAKYYAKHGRTDADVRREIIEMTLGASSGALDLMWGCLQRIVKGKSFFVQTSSESYGFLDSH